MEYSYKTAGTCAQQIDFDINGNIISNIRFYGGCNGNLKAIGLLVEGKDAKEVADLLRGNDCNMKGTSCADQLARAISEHVK